MEFLYRLTPNGVGEDSDGCFVEDLLRKSCDALQPRKLFGDAGYDAEWVHEYCRES